MLLPPPTTATTGHLTVLGSSPPSDTMNINAGHVFKSATELEEPVGSVKKRRRRRHVAYSLKLSVWFEAGWGHAGGVSLLDICIVWFIF